MARFDPNTFPDRFALEANARRLRRAEISRLFDAAVASVLQRLRRGDVETAPLIVAGRPAPGLR